MIKKLVAITFIFICTTIAWAVLGSTIFARTYGTDERLRKSVESIWGAPQEQLPPSAYYEREVVRTVSGEESGKNVVRTVREVVAEPLPLESSVVNAALDLEHRQKGLLWYSTYKVKFASEYEFSNPTGKGQWVTFVFSLPAERAVYDDLSITVDGAAVAAETGKNAIHARAFLSSGQTRKLGVAYYSQGLDSWHYKFGSEVAQVRNFRLTLRTNFRDVDFSDDTLAPTAKDPTSEGWRLSWTYKNMLSGIKLGVMMPEKLQPGPFAGHVSFFAPVSLFFFFFLLFIITTIRGIDLHPMNYFFLACAFFAFHLLLAYLVDHISVHVAFFFAAGVSLFLVVSYLRLVVGNRFALVEAGLGQFVYLILFSYAFFFEGFTGLTITIGAILTLFVVMQMTARTKWNRIFAQEARGNPPGGSFHPELQRGAPTL